MADVIFKKGTGNLPTASTEGTLYFDTSTGLITLDLETNAIAKSSSRLVLNANNANVANKLGTSNKGSSTNPIYLNKGVPTACTYYLNKTVPSDAIFTDTTYNDFGLDTSVHGLVPPSNETSNTTKYLKADGTWDTPQDTIYTLPLARTDSLGGIQVGFSESNSGSNSNRNYAVMLNGNNAYVNVPWTDTTSFNIAANSADGIFDLTGTSGTNAVSYAIAPYSSKQDKSCFYTGSTNPTRSDRLNYNGYLYSTKLYSEYGGGGEVKPVKVLTSNGTLSSSAYLTGYNTFTKNYNYLYQFNPGDNIIDYHGQMGTVEISSLDSINVADNETDDTIISWFELPTIYSQYLAIFTISFSNIDIAQGYVQAGLGFLKKKKTSSTEVSYEGTGLQNQSKTSISNKATAIIKLVTFLSSDRDRCANDDTYNDEHPNYWCLALRRWSFQTTTPDPVVANVKYSIVGII